jgi:excisionase family DNA binding protein
MEMISTSEAAAKLICSRFTVVKAIHEGRLTARRIGRSWIVVEDAKFAGFELRCPGRSRR